MYGVNRMYMLGIIIIISPMIDIAAFDQITFMFDKKNSVGSSSKYPPKPINPISIRKGIKIRNINAIVPNIGKKYFFISLINFALLSVFLFFHLLLVMVIIPT